MLIITKTALYEALRLVIGVVDQRPLLPILSHVLLEAEGDQLSITATNSEVELVSYAQLAEQVNGKIQMTISGRKLADICRALSDDTVVSVRQSDQEWVSVRAGDSHFTLAALPADTFPTVIFDAQAHSLQLAQQNLLDLLAQTHFSIAERDIRYFLNGIFMEVNGQFVRCTAMDGHRLAIHTVLLPDDRQPSSDCKAILPRKGSAELIRLLNADDTILNLSITAHHMRVQAPHFSLTCNLILGEHPGYQSLIFTDFENSLTLEVEAFKQSLIRVAILANEKFHGLRLELANDTMRIVANNSEQEKAEVVMPVNYQGKSVDLGFNVNYLLDVLNVMRADRVNLQFNDEESNVLLKEEGSAQDCYFAIMPLIL